MVEPLNLIPATEQTQTAGEPLDLTIVKNNAPPMEIAKARGNKAAFAIDEPDKSFAFETQILNGDEEELRTQIATSRALKNVSERRRVISDILANAKQLGGLTPEDEFNIQQLSLKQLEKTNTILEKAYAERASQLALQRGQNHLLREAIGEDPEATHTIMDVFEDQLARKEVLQNIFEEVQTIKTGRDTLNKVSDVAELFVPFLFQARTTETSDSIFGGEAMLAQVQRLRALPLDEFETEVRKLAIEIAEGSPFEAEAFLQAVGSFTNNDRSFDNLFTIIDAVDIATLGVVAKGTKGLLKGATALTKPEELATAVRDTAKAFNRSNPQPSDVLSAAGNNPEAVKAAILEGKFTGKTTRTAEFDIQSLDDLGWHVPSLYNVDYYKNLGGRLTRAFADRSIKLFNDDEVLRSQAKVLRDAVLQTTTVVRNTPEALNAAFKSTQRAIRQRFNRLDDAIVDVIEVVPEGSISRVGAVIMHVGKPDGTLFKSKLEAASAARNYKLPLNSFDLQQQGAHWYISIQKQLNETSDIVRDTPISTLTETPRNFLNAFLGFFRNPDDLVSFFERGNRNAATHLTQELRHAVTSVADTLSKKTLGKKRLRDLGRIINSGRTHITKDPVTGDTRIGRFHRSQGDLEQEYMRLLGRLPDEDEVRAYFTYVQLSDFDWMLRNLGIFRDKSRLGIENYSFSTYVNLENGDRVFTELKAEGLEGVQRTGIPWDDDVGILVQRELRSEPEFIRTSRIALEQRQAFQDLLDKEHKLIEVANPSARPFNRVMENVEVNFVIAPSIKFSPLKFKQLPNRPGGHLNYNDGWFAKSPVIEETADGRIIYSKDMSLFTASSKAQMDGILKNFNLAREQYKPFLNGTATASIDALRTFVREKLPMTWDEFTGLFKDELSDPNDPTSKIIGPRISIDRPTFSVKAGQNVGQTVDLARVFNIPDLKDSVNGKFNLFSEVNKRYAGDRDQLIPSVQEGTEANPYVHFKEASLLDPFTTINQALTELTRARNLEDLKTSAVERYIREFGDTLDDTISNIRNNPVDALHNTPFKRNHPDQTKVAAARNARRSLLNFLGTKTAVREAIDGMLQKTIDFTFNTLGQRGSDFLASRQLFAVSDPFKYARTIAFHSKLGLFNPLQLILQAQSMTHVIALAGPKNGFAGTAAAVLTQFMRMSSKKNVIEHFGNMATKFGWTKDEFLESWTEFHKSGLFRIEGEVAQLDDFTDPSIFQGRIGSFFDKGTIFFREGERMVRTSSWHTAFKEWRSLNPGKKLDDTARNAIKVRANDMFVNMTRASTSAVQQGILSLPTQFLSFQVRLMEQMLGGRLTVAEKLRVMGTYSIMYGMPVGIFGTAFGGVAPAYEDIKTAALSNGIEVNDGALNLMFHGLPDFLLQVATGEQFNFSERFGPNGNQVFKEALTGEKGLLEVALGASGSILGSMIEQTSPLMRSVYQVLSGEEDALPLLVSDFADAAAEVSTVNNLTKAFYAINSGKYVSRNEIFVDEINNTQAIFSAFGLTPREISDTFLKLGNMKQISDMQNDAKKKFTKYYRKALNADSQEEMTIFLKRAKVYKQMGDPNAADYARWIKDALKNNENLVDKINRGFALDAPASKAKGRIDQIIEGTTTDAE